MSRDWNFETWFTQHAILLNSYPRTWNGNNDGLRVHLNRVNFCLVKMRLACSPRITLSLQLSWNFRETYIAYICNTFRLRALISSISFQRSQMKCKTLSELEQHRVGTRDVNAHLTSAWCKLLALLWISQRESMATLV